MGNHNLNNDKVSLPYSVWPAEDLHRLEYEGANSLGLSLYALMQHAGQAAYECIRQCWPMAQHWLIVCGSGNNGGDGFVIARLAQAAGYQITLLACEGQHPLPEEAEQARQAWLEAGGVIHAATSQWPAQIDVIIDALLGTGMTRAPDTAYATLIRQINTCQAPVFAVDVPSGLVAANGTVPGEVVNATHTLTFIALKPGLLTGQARNYVGRLHYHHLGLEGWLAEQQAPMHRYDAGMLSGWLTPRRATAHKGDHGRLLMVGGDHGTAGAIRMAAEAALRSGAGLVRVLTQACYIAPLLAVRPELMAVELNEESLAEGVNWAEMIAIGPGLGQRAWGKQALQRLVGCNKPMLWDADALNLLAQQPFRHSQRIMTPHSGEAARLLGSSIAAVEADRVQAARQLVKRYGGIVILKGAGTIIASETGELAFADTGNAGMASGGMGDILSGIIAALIVQGFPLYQAACAGAVAHGAAADRVAVQRGMRGMLAMDVITALWPFINPEMKKL